MPSYLGPNPMPAPSTAVRLGPLAWSGAAPLTRLDGVAMMVLSGGTLTNTGRVPVRVAVQPVNGAGTSTGAVVERSLAPQATWTLAAPAPAGGWLVVAMTTAGAQALVGGMLAAGVVGLGLAAYGGYAAQRDLRRRWRTHHPRPSR